MYVEADTLQIPQEGWKGVILDEMSIQQSIDIVRSRDNLLLVGFRDMGDETNSIKTIKEKKHQQTPSSHIFQLLYLPFLWVNKPVSVIYKSGTPYNLSTRGQIPAVQQDLRANMSTILYRSI